jgi:putative endonuclease
MSTTKTQPKAKKPATPKEPKAPKAAKEPKQPKAAKPPKAPKASKPKPPAKPKKLSGLDAAAKVLVDMGVPMNAKQIMAEVLSRKLWETSGATPESTIYAAMIREIAAKGKDSRFKKTERGLFTANKG